MPETDAHYLDAFRRGLLDPEECVARWEHMHSEAIAHALRLAELDNQTDEAWEGAKAMLSESNSQVKDARRRLALYREHHVADPPPPPPPASRPRPRERRARRTAARSASSSGDDPPGLPRGLAVCPLCGNEAIVRPRCPLCRQTGFVGRELRNAWKRGQR